jgi:hypothetical protein
VQKKIVRKIRSYKRGRLPSLGFWLGLLLAQGAPLGLFVHLYFLGLTKAMTLCPMSAHLEYVFQYLSLRLDRNQPLLFTFWMAHGKVHGELA